MKTLICGYVLQGGINTSVLHGGIYVKSIIPRGPADKDGQIKIGNMSGIKTWAAELTVTVENETHLGLEVLQLRNVIWSIIPQPVPVLHVGIPLKKTEVSHRHCRVTLCSCHQSRDCDHCYCDNQMLSLLLTVYPGMF